jgi:eukaryotic-like serine/threonine-protein kinase
MICGGSFSTSRSSSPQPSWIERVNLWWRREPVLVSHLSAILAVLLIVLISKLLSEQVSQNAPWVITLLLVWAAGSYLFQQLSISDRYQTAAYWGWAAFDVVVYTTLIFIAEPPRGLLLIGYPMMIAASGLLYRVRFVVFVTAMCIAGFTILLATVNDSLTEQPEFCVIYTSGLVVLALCLISMIRRVRGLADYFACGR